MFSVFTTFWYPRADFQIYYLQQGHETCLIYRHSVLWRQGHYEEHMHGPFEGRLFFHEQGQELL